MEIPITNGFYVSDSAPISNQECTNWRPNFPQVEGALTQGNLFGTEGLNQLISTGLIENINRGQHTKDGSPYFLNGTILSRVDRTVDSEGNESFVTVAIGTIPGADRASFADNGKQLMIVVGGDGFIVDESGAPVFQEITDAGFKANGVPQQVRFVDSFFLVTTDSKTFIRSDSNNGLSWNALNKFTAEADPDDIVSIIIYKNQAFIAGSQTIEAFQDLAGVFQRNGFIIDKGVFAPFSMVKSSDSFMFVGGGVDESPAIWSLTGNTVQKVSNTAIDSVLRDLSQEEIQGAFAFSYAQSGAYIVGFTFASRTFEYNTVTSKWNERKSQIINSKGLTETIRWRVNSLGTAFNRILVGDSIDGRIGVLDADSFTEYGEPIIRDFSSPTISNQGKPFSIPMLEVTMESGVADVGAKASVIRMSSSKDLKKFGNELTRTFGKIGEFDARAIWPKLGRFPRYGQVRLVMSDAVKPVMIKLEANVVGG